jgi:hypothetical protein
MGVEEEPNIAEEFQHRQLEQLRQADPRCRVLEMPDGVLLRYTLAQSLFFYLRSRVEDGKLNTRVWASDSPYDRQKAHVGDVISPLFKQESEANHMRRVLAMLRDWVRFVADDAEQGSEFVAFQVGNPPE